MNKEIFENSKKLLDEIKAKFPNRVKKVGDLLLDDPILSPYNYPFVFLADRDPTDDEPDIYHGYAGLILIWENETSGDFFISPDNTASPLVWNKIATDANILSILSSLGWQTNTSRAWSLRSSPSFGTEYTPNSTNDTEVISSVTITLTGEIQAQVNSGSGYVIVAQTPGSDVITFTVPANSTYKIVSVSGLSNAIVSIAELTK